MATNTISGTSMATPHVAGVAALLLQPAYMTPADVASALVDNATTGKVTGLTSKKLRGTPNLLLFTN